MSQENIYKFDINNKWLERLSVEEGKVRKLDPRNPYQRDKARILHSAAFRRLQSKTQVHNNGSSDFYRTRLTHSLEVAQIGSGIVAFLKVSQKEFSELLPCNELIESISFAHDIGHPPFGHGGEIALNYMMIKSGGFEGNAQTFRILTQLEPYTRSNGMNLSRRTLLGVLKYPVPLSQITRTYPTDNSKNFRQLKTSEWIPAKGIYDHDLTLLNEVLSPLDSNDRKLFSTLRKQDQNNLSHKKSRYKSIDCSIMEIADDIAYGIHDLEDAIAMGIVSKTLWVEKVSAQLANIEGFTLASQLTKITEDLFSLQHYKRKDAIGALINALITSIEIRKVDIDFSDPLLSYNAFLTPAMFQSLDILKQFVLNYVIASPELQVLEYRGQQIVMELFETFNSDPARFLPMDIKEIWQSNKNDSSMQERIISDYISSLTDAHALRLHANFFSSSSTTPMNSQFNV